MTRDERKRFEEAAEPLMRYLGENHHPHVSVLVTNNKAELVEGLFSHVTDKFIKD